MSVSPLGQAQECEPAQTWAYSLLGQLEHDPAAFTQGLVFAQGALAESTGLYGASRLIYHQAPVADELRLPDKLFGEGLAWFDNKLWQLSWKAGELRIYSINPLQLYKRIRYRGQGWGLTHSGDHFIMSNGSDTLQFRSSKDFAVAHSRKVRSASSPLPYLNELEWVHGLVLANIWQRDDIAVIAPESGCVLAWLKLHELWPRSIRPPQADVLNGIAWQSETQQLWVTGKRWPRIYRLDVPKLIQAGKHRTGVK